MGKSRFRHPTDRYILLYRISVPVAWLLSIFAALMIPVCYAPDQLAKALGPEWEPWLRSWLVRAATIDRSGAEGVCAALMVIALARFALAREKQIRQLRAMERTLVELRPSARSDGLSLDELGSEDPARNFLQGAIQLSHREPRDPSATLQLLQRTLARQNTVRSLISPMVSLGLVGTLLSLWIGFSLTFGHEGATQLQTSIRQAVIVVATAAMSSVLGISIGQFVLAPLSNVLDRHTNLILDKAIAIENQAESRQ
jgi:hypothetical protein